MASPALGGTVPSHIPFISTHSHFSHQLCQDFIQGSLYVTQPFQISHRNHLHQLENLDPSQSSWHSKQRKPCVSWRQEATEARAPSGWHAFSAMCVPLNCCFSTPFKERKLQKSWDIWASWCTLNRGNHAYLEVFLCLRKHMVVMFSNTCIRTLDVSVETKGQSIWN